MKYLSNFFIGILIGFGAILPGISSGVFCVIFGIYEKLVDSIINFFKDIKNYFLFLLPIAIGFFTGVVLFGNLTKYIFELYQTQSCFAFMGLILGTIPALFKEANQRKICINNKYNSHDFVIHHRNYFNYIRKTIRFKYKYFYLRFQHNLLNNSRFHNVNRYNSTWNK